MDELKDLISELLEEALQHVDEEALKQLGYKYMCKAAAWAAAQTDNTLDDAAVSLLCKALGVEED